jgi:hypothetical protein
MAASGFLEAEPITSAENDRAVPIAGSSTQKLTVCGRLP